MKPRIIGLGVDPSPLYYSTSLLAKTRKANRGEGFKFYTLAIGEEQPELIAPRQQSFKSMFEESNC